MHLAKCSVHITCKGHVPCFSKVLVFVCVHLIETCKVIFILGGLYLASVLSYQGIHTPLTVLEAMCELFLLLKVSYVNEIVFYKVEFLKGNRPTVISFAPVILLTCSFAA